MSDLINEIRNSHTFRLFKRPHSFMGGVGAIFSWHNSLYDNYNTSNSDEEADLRSIGADWLAVGVDLGKSLKKYGKEQEQKERSA